MMGMGGLGNDLSPDQRKIIDYAVAHDNGAEIALAVEGGATAASAYVMHSDATVVGMGGFMGSDNAPSTDQLQQWVTDGKLKFILGSGRMGGFGGLAGGQGGTAGGFGGFGGGGAQQERTQWIQQHCKVVDPSAYGATPAPKAPAAATPPPGAPAAGAPGAAGPGAGARPATPGGQTLYECTA
jgi:hypothetical protein